MARSRGIFPSARSRAPDVSKSMMAGKSTGGPPARRDDGAGESTGSLGARSTQQSGGEPMKQKTDGGIPARRDSGLGFGGFSYDSSMSSAWPETYARIHSSKVR